MKCTMLYRNIGQNCLCFLQNGKKKKKKKEKTTRERGGGREGKDTETMNYLP